MAFPLSDFRMIMFLSDRSYFKAFVSSGDRLGLCLLGLFKAPMIRDLAEETVDGSAFDDFSSSSMLAIIGTQLGLCLIG